jgi:hypothetical protein
MGGTKGMGGAQTFRLEQLARQLLGGTKGIRRGTLRAGEAVQAGRDIPGGLGAALPSLGRTIEEQKAATSGALREFGETSGLAGTPFGERIRAQIGQQGALAQTQARASAADTALQRAIQMSGVQSQLASNLFGGATALGQTQAQTQSTANISRMTTLAKVLQGK